MSSVADRLAKLSPAKRALLQLSKSIGEQEQFGYVEINKRDRSSGRDVLSFAQQRLWFLDQLEGANATYNMPIAFRLHGQIDYKALHRVFDEIIQRHESLRTNFQSERGQPAQVIAERVTLHIPQVDLSFLDVIEQERQLETLLRLEAQKTFNLTRDLLLRVSILRLSALDNVVSVSIHHIISDGWSVGNVLLHEFKTLYEAFVKGQPSPLPALKIQYGDFASWQRNWLSGSRLNNQLNYWKNKLAGVPALIDLPTDRPRPPAQTFSGAAHSFALPAELLTEVKALSQAAGCTLFMTLLAGFSALLSRYSRQEDVVVGSPIANRTHPDLEPLIGFFVNTLVMRTSLGPETTGHELLAQVRNNCLEAFQNQDIPFERLVEHLKPERNPSFTPLFQVMFILQTQNQERTGLKIGDLSMTSIPMDTATSMFDLTLKLEEQGGELLGEFEYNTALFDLSWIERFVSYYTNMLKGLIQSRDQIVARIPLMSASQAKAVLFEANQTYQTLPTEQSIVSLFEEQARQSPDNIAVSMGEQSITYAELNLAAEKFASYLFNKGVGVETLVGLCLDRSINMMVGLLGILKAGAAYIPLDPDYPKERLAAMIESAQLGIIVAQTATESCLPDAKHTSHAAHISCRVAVRILLDRDWSEILITPPRANSPNIAPESLAYVIYTSGSTGKPKGVQISHQALLNFLLTMQDQQGLQTEDVLLAVTTISFDIAGLELYLPLITGARVVLVSRETVSDGFQLLREIETHLPTVMQATPSTWRMLLATGTKTFPMRRILCGGEALDSALANQLVQTDAQIWNLYGPTETTIWSVATKVKRTEAEKNAQLGSGAAIGLPIGNTQTYILDASLDPTPQGLSGELYIGGLGVGRGYLGQPGLTAERFLPDPYSEVPGARIYRTGDLVRAREDGIITYVGRIDHQVKIRGFRIELGEIEAKLAEHPAVSHAVAIARPDHLGQAQLVAYVETKTDWKESTQDQGRTNTLNEKWQTVWNETYRGTAGAETSWDDLSGWLSSHTRQPIPKEEMKEWVTQTVSSILALKPQRVMEIGCGTGLLLSRLAPHVAQYTGVDFSRAVIERLQRRLETHSFDHVSLLCRDANDLHDIEQESVDTFVINSVAQYFPTVDYLIQALLGACSKVADGGRLFIGDLRGLQMLELQHTSVQLFQAEDHCDKEELNRRIQAAIDREEELLIHPRFFSTLRSLEPRIQSISLRLKSGAAHNEMTCFRYDVVIEIGRQPFRSVALATLQAALPEIDTSQHALTLEGLTQRLRDHPLGLCLRNVDNQRLQHDAATHEWLKSTQFHQDVAAFRKQLGQTPVKGLSIASMTELANTLGMEMGSAWSERQPYRTMDIVFVKKESDVTMHGIAIEMVYEDAALKTPNFAAWTNYPDRNLSKKLLISSLRQTLQEALPAYMVPASIVCLDRLPLTPNGKIDRFSLPAPDAVAQQATYLAPRNEAEMHLVRIWEDILGIERIGVRDNFFNLGGHSLLAVQVISKIRDYFSIELPLQALFDAPTLGQLAELLTTNQPNNTLQAPTIRLLTEQERTHAPLSFSQQRLWFLNELEGTSVTYHISGAVKIKGALVVETLERCFDEIVLRHETLRTHFVKINGAPVAKLAPHQPFKVQRFSVLNETKEQKAVSVAQLLENEATETFDLTQDLLLRVTLIQTNHHEHVMMLTLHHIISDEWSLGLLQVEVAKLYSAFSQAQTSPLAPLPLQFADYAAWQRQWMTRERLAEHLNYWVSELHDAPTLLELPTDRPRPAVQRYIGKTIPFRIEPSLTSRLRTLGHSCGATLFMTLLSGWSVLLSRHARTSDLVIGSPVTNRSRSELESLIGFFVNTVALRIRIDRTKSTIELLEQNRQKVLDAFKHQDVPFEYIVQDVKPERNLSHAPIFQTMFVMQNAPSADLSFGGLALEFIEQELRAAKFDLTLSIEEHQAGLNGVIEFNTDLFDASSITRMIEQYEYVLASMAQRPAAMIDSISLMSSYQAKQLSDCLHASATTETHTQTKIDAKLPSVLEQFKKKVLEQPEAIALSADQATLSYGELNARAEKIAAHIRTFGVRAHDVVGLYAEPTPEMIISLLAILKAGATYLPLLPGTPAERLSLMLNECSAKLVIDVTDSLLKVPGSETPVLTLEQLTQTEDKVYQDWGLDEKGIAYIIYTSGSTGQPKGVMVTRDNLAQATLSRLNYYNNEFSGLILLQPFSFDVATGNIFWTLCAGATLFLEPRSVAQDPQRLLDCLVRTQSSHLVLLPLLYAPLLDLATPEQLLALRTIIVGGEQMPLPLVQKHKEIVPQAGLFNEYGPTETTIMCCAYACAVHDSEQPIPIGRPMSPSKMYLFDHALHHVPSGLTGEICVGGPQVSSGYLGRPALTAEHFLPDPFSDQPGARMYRSGDLGKINIQGNIEFLGRQDHQVKIRGFRVELGEIEATLRAHPGVAELVVVAVKQGSSKKLTAYLVPHTTDQSNQQSNLITSLTQFARSSLPEYMVPSAFVLMQALPLTANGKLDHKSLPAPDSITPSSTFTAARNGIEEKLCKIWGNVLGIQQVGIHDNFFMLGGDSILSIQIVSRANQLGLGLSVKQLYQHQTIAKLSGQIGQGNTRLIEQGPLNGPFLLGPVQHWFLDQHPPEPHHFNQSLLLNLQTGLTQDIIFKAFSAIASHHDMLRSRFICKTNGWQAHIEPIEECTASVHSIDLRDLPVEQRSTAMIEHARKAQASLDLARGSISTAIRYHLSDEGPDKLLWIIHHLSVDGISWRILLEDLEQALEQCHGRREISFQPKTDSFPAWSQRLTDYSASNECEAELNYWKNIVSTEVLFLPVDTVSVVDPRLNTKSSALTLTKILPATLSEALLLKAPSAFKTQMNDVLLAALMMALNRWTGQNSARITLEGHGREELFEDIDISRTVGWFTSGFPVVLTKAPSNNHIDNILHTKNLLQSIPNKGVGFGILSFLHPDQAIRQSLHGGHDAQLSFNYLGQFKASQASTWILGEALEPTDHEHSPLGMRKPLIEINALHCRDHLEVNWTFSINLHHTKTIDLLAEHFMNVLTEIVALCDVGPNNLQDLYPLSPMQQGMLFHSQLGQEPGAYTIQLSSRMQGDFCPSLFMKAWQEVLDRHPSLRAVIVTPPGLDPLQKIVSQAKLPWFDFDWRDLSPEAQHEQWLALLDTDRKKGFDAETCPLMRCTLVQIEDHSWRFLWSHHHLLTDGWCLPILMREVLECYESFVSDRPYDAPLPPLYREYIEWLQSKDLDQAKTFWRDYLQGFDTPTSLGVDQKRLLAHASSETRDNEPRYGSCTIALDVQTTHSLTQLARIQGLTLSVLIQSAWSVLLSRYSGSDDVVFGATVSGRPAEIVGVEQMIGLFINTLPVRARIDTSESLPAFFLRMRDDQLTRDEYAFTPLVDIHACTDIPKRHSLFDSIVIFENYPVDSTLDAQAQALRIDEVEVHEQTGFPLTLTAAPGECIPLKLSWETSRFETGQAVRLLEHLTNLLTRLTTDLPNTVAQWSTSMMGTEEVEQLTQQFNRTAHESPDHQCTFFELFERRVQTHASSIAVICAEEKISYAELYARSLAIGASLREHGAIPGTRIGIYQHRTINMVATLLAIQSTGATYVPLDPGYPSGRIQYMLDDSQALLIISEDTLLHKLPKTTATRLSVQTLLKGTDNLDSTEISDKMSERVDAKMQNLAYIIYTSGSTGRPKGVPISHASLTNFLLSMQRTPGLTDHDVLLAVTTISFDIAGLELYLPLITGSRVVLASRKDAVDSGKLSTLIQDHGVTVLQATPTTWRMLLETKHTITSLKKGFCGGEGVPQELAQNLIGYGIEFWNLYGPTETTVWSCAKHIEAHAISAPYEDIGHPIDNTQIYIVDQYMNLMPRGAPGELLIGGAGLSLGYWHRADLTAEKFVPDPFGLDASAKLYRTGDLAYQRADGSFVCLGRIDHQIKIRGFRVEPGEIEALIKQHPSVKQALVSIWTPHPDDKRLVAYVVNQQDESNTDTLKSWLRTQLPAYMIPTEWVILDNFPLTPNGKLDRQALPEPGRDHHDAFVEPSTHTEALITELMSQTLQISRISATDDFFDLGGHSLLAGRFVAAVSNKLSVQLPLSTIFEKSTVKALSEHIDSLLWATKQMNPRSEVLSHDEEEFRL